MSQESGTVIGGAVVYGIELLGLRFSLVVDA
jgi:hypothetical protein